MKNLTASLIVLSSLFAINSASAVDVINNDSGKEKVGVVSADGAYTLDQLTNQLIEKAKNQGATSIKVTSAGGKNKLYGTADIYK